eukprot:scaffold524819_cov36-Prasinocladus_malaysianus.AAC.1
MIGRKASGNCSRTAEAVFSPERPGMWRSNSITEGSGRERFLRSSKTARASSPSQAITILNP